MRTVNYFRADSICPYHIVSPFKKQTIQANSKRNRLQQLMKPIAFIPKSNLSSWAK